MLDATINHARANREGYLTQLLELLRIPSISTLSEHASDVRRAAEWLAAELTRIGLRHVQIIPTRRHPLVYGDWLEAGKQAPTVLVYGHYDVQPVDPLDLWETPPFEPQVRDGKIYARGASDDKGQLFVHLKAIESILAVEGRLPVNVKMIFEGEEESGSDSIEAFVPANRDLLAADSLLVSDTSFLEPGQPLIIYALRGIVAAEVRVIGPRTDLHSGGYGGTVHNPAQVVGEIIAALHDAEGRVTIPGFYDRVRPIPAVEREALERAPFTLERWRQLTGLEKPWGEPGYSLLERIGLRPTCEVNGIWGGFQGEGSKTIIPAEAGAKFTMRLVSHQEPGEIGQLFADYVKQIAPDDVTVEVHVGHGGWPVVTPIDTPEMKAASRAYEAAWGVPPVFQPGGGSIPVVAIFQRELQVPVVLMGFGLAGCGIHAPNEYFPVEHFFRGLEAAIHYYYNLVA